MENLVFKKSDLGLPGAKFAIQHNEIRLALFHLEDGFFAMSNVCKHMDALLTDGPLTGNTIACPLHGWEYDVRTGECTAPKWGKMKKDVDAYPIEDRGDVIAVQLIPKKREEREI